MRELNIVAEAYTESHKSLWKRRYARLDTAIPRATALAVLGALKPGQKVVFYHAVTGLEIGHVKVPANGHVVSKWIWS